VSCFVTPAGSELVSAFGRRILRQGPESAPRAVAFELGPANVGPESISGTVEETSTHDRALILCDQLFPIKMSPIYGKTRPEVAE